MSHIIEGIRVFRSVFHLFQIKFIYYAVRILLLMCDRFGTKRPRVRIPPLRPQMKPRKYKASGVFLMPARLALGVNYVWKLGEGSMRRDVESLAGKDSGLGDVGEK